MQDGPQAQPQGAEQRERRTDAQKADPGICPGSKADAPNQQARKGRDPQRQAFDK